MGDVFYLCRQKAVIHKQKLTLELFVPFLAMYPYNFSVSGGVFGLMSENFICLQGRKKDDLMNGFIR